MKVAKQLFVMVVLTFLAVSCVSGQNTTDKNRQEYSKSMSVIGASLNLLNRYFVDTIDMKRTTRYGINAMLESLDPYTEYFSKDDTDQLKMMTTGEYGGIGAVIAQTKDSIVYIRELMHNMPADKAGIKAGDQIIKVDSISFGKTTSSEVTKLLKGVPGTELKICVKRLNDSKPRWITVKREKIVINPVPYYGVLPSGIGYISLMSFTDTASEEVKSALKSLLSQNVKGVILDLRNNGGGLITEAVNIVSLFVPKSSLVVTTKGRNMEEKNKFLTQTDPISAEIPLAVMINRNSASASEIVSGALQDLDRAVIVGEKSFGKGLVQTTMRLPYNGILKLTTAKYYIPSGRCIQKINYHDVREGKEGKELPDSLTAIFHTKSGREVHDAGGIMPDVKAQRDSLPAMLLYLSADKDVFDWVTNYQQKHKTIAPVRSFSITDNDYEDFSKMAKARNISYDIASKGILSKLIDLAKFEGYYEKNKDAFSDLEKKLSPHIDEDLVAFKPQIKYLLNSSIITRYYYNRGAVEKDVLTDNAIKKATEVLLDKNKYESILQPAVNSEK